MALKKYFASRRSASLNDALICVASLRSFPWAKPSFGSNFVDRKNEFKESEINILLGPECERNKILHAGGEINNLSSSKTPAPLPW